jgi:GNAT superfamily N-acetyltransferase
MEELAAYHGDKPAITAKHFEKYALGPKALSSILVAFSDGKPIGFAAFFDWMNFVRGTPVRTLDLLYVQQGFRGTGVGKLLVGRIASDALKNGIERLDTSAAKTNAAANACYKRLGFEQRNKPSNAYWLCGKKALHKASHH